MYLLLQIDGKLVVGSYLIGTIFIEIRSSVKLDLVVWVYGSSVDVLWINIHTRSELDIIIVEVDRLNPKLVETIRSLKVKLIRPLNSLLVAQKWYKVILGVWVYDLFELYYVLWTDLLELEFFRIFEAAFEKSGFEEVVVAEELRARKWILYNIF